jgi:hypothetical protein
MDNITTMNRRKGRLQFNKEEKKVQLLWNEDFKDREFQSTSYDYAVISAPFTMVRTNTNSFSQATHSGIFAIYAQCH